MEIICVGLELPLPAPHAQSSFSMCEASECARARLCGWVRLLVSLLYILRDAKAESPFLTQIYIHTHSNAHRKIVLPNLMMEYVVGICIFITFALCVREGESEKENMHSFLGNGAWSAEYGKCNKNEILQSVYPKPGSRLLQYTQLLAFSQRWNGLRSMVGETGSEDRSEKRKVD